MDNETKKVSESICNEMYDNLKEGLLEKWYPLVVDYKYGGYLTNLTFDMEVMGQQDKMIVSQARHMWTTSKAAGFFNNTDYHHYSLHGFKFFKERMWDSEYGGYFQIRDRKGNLSKVENWLDEKRTYGNAFAVYGLAALYNQTKNKDVLDQAIKSFDWIEQHAFDPIHKGYYQFLTKEGKVFGKNTEYKTKATDAVEAGYKDQNSSIHMLEAYTELYNVWKYEKLYRQLLDLLLLIRDRMVHPKGYLQLFFQPDWTPVSFRNAPKEERENNFRLDHVSFGHDYETSFLMLEASHLLGLNDDHTTLTIAKKMIDHAIENGWDENEGGFFDEGYYFDENNECKIIKDTKNWWAQAEALNSLLLFSSIYPEEEKYFELFVKEWNYIKKYLIDHEHGDWYWGSLEKEPFYKTEPKGSIWKATYHNGRALMNCIKMLADKDFILYKSNPQFAELVKEQYHFINHWRKIAEKEKSHAE
ncbi:MAG: AGE family epimerase/isomerase [Bacteroidota bacterium]